MRIDSFAREVEKEDLDLARACLLVARDEHPAIDPDEYLARFDAWVMRVADARDDLGDFPAALRVVLAEEEHFRGNFHEYEDPDNSYLDRVLDRRLGIPITLSVVYLEVARRLGEPLVAVAMPAHFLVRHEGTMLDPFHGGVTRTWAECADILRRATGGRATLTDEMLRPASDRDVLARVLTNLKHAYVRAQDPFRALRVVNRLLQLAPFSVTEYRDRGLIRRALGEAAGARDDLERYLSALPKAKDAAAVRKLADRLPRS